MLRNFRQVFKGQQMPMAVIMMVVLLGMVAYLAPSHGNPDAPDSVVARVYGRDVMRRDLDRAIAQIARRTLGKNADMDAALPFLKLQAMSALVRDKLMEEMAARHGVVVTDAEVKTALEAQLRQIGFVGKDNQLMPSSVINDALRERGWSLKMLETDITSELSKQKLFQEAAAQVPVDGAWLTRENRVRTEKVSFEAVTLAPDPSAVPDPGQAKLEAFLQAGGARFQTGPRRVVEYVAVTPAALGVTPADDVAVKAYYDSRGGQFTELHASHILFKAQSEAEVQDAIKKATELRAKLVAGQDFNKTAETVSQDPTAKANKGDLGWFEIGRMDKSFEEAALALKPGEISQPVRSSFGVHLIKLEGRREKSFDQVKEQLRSRLTQEKFATKAKDKLEQLRKRVGDRGELAAAARNLGLKAQTSQPFAEEPGAAIDGLAGSQGVIASVFRMDVGQVSKVLPYQDGFLVARVQEEKPIAVPPLAEIRAKVLDAWRQDESRKALQAKLQGAAKGGDLKALGTPEAKDAVTIASLGELGAQPAIRKALLDTPVGQATPVLWTADGKAWVARIKARTPAEALTFGARRALVLQVQSDVAQKMLTAELQSLEHQGDLHGGFSSLYGRYNGIWRNKDVLGAVDTVSDYLNPEGN